MTDLAEVALIGGSSHAGKSTLARALAAQSGRRYISTDTLARHPGRPWPTPAGDTPAHVADHYLTLTPPQLLEDVLAHYRRMWPGIERLIAARADDPGGAALALEGSALWPEQVATLRDAGVRAVWLTGPDELFRARILHGSGYAASDRRGRAMIESFLERTLLYNRAMMDAVRRLGLASIAIEAAMSPADIRAHALGALAR